MSIDRVVIGFSDNIILISVILALIINIKFLYLTVFIEFMLLQSAFTKFSPMAKTLKKIGFESVTFF